MAFLETSRLDSKIERGAKIVPMNPGRTKVYTISGKLKQKFAASLPLHKADVSHGVRSQAEFQTVIDLWYVVNFTPYSGFRFRNWQDYKLTQANSKLSLISGSVYQINRLHTFGAIEFLRPIYKPTSGVVVYRTTSGVVSVATATVDTTNGQVTISGHTSGDTYTCVGEFDLPVTFVDNEWTGSLDVHINNLHIISDPIMLEEIRL